MPLNCHLAKNLVFNLLEYYNDFTANSCELQVVDMFRHDDYSKDRNTVNIYFLQRCPGTDPRVCPGNLPCLLGIVMDSDDLYFC